MYTPFFLRSLCKIKCDRFSWGIPKEKYPGSTELRFGLDGVCCSRLGIPYSFSRVILAEMDLNFTNFFLQNNIGPFFKIFRCGHGEHSKDFWKPDPFLGIFFYKIGPMFSDFLWKSDPLEQHIPICLKMWVTPGKIPRHKSYCLIKMNIVKYTTCLCMFSSLSEHFDLVQSLSMTNAHLCKALTCTFLRVYGKIRMCLYLNHCRSLSRFSIWYYWEASLQCNVNFKEELYPKPKLSMFCTLSQKRSL